MKLVRKIMHPAFVKIRRQLNRSKLLRFGSAVSDFPNVLEVRTSFSTREIHLRCPFFLISSSLGQNGGHMTRFFWIWSKLVSSNLMIKNIVTIFVTVLISSEKLLVIYIFRHADVSGIPVFFPGLKTFFYFISWYRSQRDFCSAPFQRYIICLHLKKKIEVLCGGRGLWHHSRGYLWAPLFCKSIARKFSTEFLNFCRICSKKILNFKNGCMICHVRLLMNQRVLLVWVLLVWLHGYMVVWS